MRIRRFLFVLIVALAVLAPVMTSKTRADAPSPPELVGVLSQLQNLDDGSFLQVARWARAGADTVYNPTFDYEKLEVSINILDHDLRYAVLQWLRGNGRHDLYNLRVTDEQIGR